MADTYYLQQMDFIDRYLRGELKEDDEARLQAINNLEEQQTIYFLDDFLAIEEDKALETTRIGYAPLKNIEYDHSIFAPGAPQYRRLTRYRLIHGPVNFYLENQFAEATTIPVITACAPNLMGTSASDLTEFSQGNDSNRELISDIYEKECQKLADFIVGAAKNAGHGRLVMPAFGVGVYVRKLNNKSQKEAQEIMYKAFADAAFKYQIPIDWIVWTFSDKPEETAQLLGSYSDNGYIQPVIHQDMLLYAKDHLDENVVILNPGSDRTVGGLYTHENPTTLEEQIAQKSDLIFLHTTLNQSMVTRFQQEFKHRKEQLKQNENAQDNDNQLVHDKDKFVKYAEKIKTVLEIKKAPYIFVDKNSYIISFRSKVSAQKFAGLLTENGITEHNGKTKFIHKYKNDYFLIRLTPDELEQIPSLIKEKQEHGRKKDTFFSPHNKNCLREAQRKRVKDQIEILEKEKKHFWALKSRKTLKINALKSLLEDTTYSSSHALVNSIVGRYPAVKKGLFSHRTADLLQLISRNKPLPEELEKNAEISPNSPK